MNFNHTDVESLEFQVEWHCFASDLSKSLSRETTMGIVPAPRRSKVDSEFQT